MNAEAKNKTSPTLDARALDESRALGVKVTAVAEDAVRCAGAEARHQRWLDENAEAFAAQAEWHAHNAHPLAEIMAEIMAWSGAAAGKGRGDSTGPGLPAWRWSWWKATWRRPIVRSRSSRCSRTAGPSSISPRDRARGWLATRS